MRLALILLLPLLAAPARAETVTVFAAASLGTALGEAAEAVEAETGHELRLVFAGSSALARQIEAGAPADIFISANPGWMDHLAEAGAIRAETRRDLLTNTLVLVSATPREPVEIDEGLDLAGIVGDGRLAMALVDAVPAGLYGKAALTSLGLWEGIAGRVVQADNVSAATRLVSSGAVGTGIVYATDAAGAGVTVLGTFPEGSHPPILYPAAAMAGTGAAAVEVLGALEGDAARAAFEAAGFGRPE